jgi:hypothetical protein
MPSLGLAVAFFSLTASLAAEDVNPPRLVEFSLEVLNADISNGPGQVGVRLRVADAEGGMLPWAPELASQASLRVVFRSPSGQQRVAGYVSLGQRASGDPYDGVYTNTVELPQYSEPGSWRVEGVNLADAAGNQRALQTADLIWSGFPVEFTISGIGDTEAPELQSLSIEPGEVDTSATNRSLLFTARVTDDQSGFAVSAYGGATATFFSPSGRQWVNVLLSSSGRVSGNELDGVYTNLVTLPRQSEPGVWSLNYFNLNDSLGNSRQLSAYAPHAGAVATSFTVASSNHAAPAWLSAITVTPSGVDAGSAEQTLAITAAVTNVASLLTGADAWQQLQLGFGSPSRKQGAGASLMLSQQQPIESTLAFTGFLTVPRGSESGVWQLTSASWQGQTVSRKLGERELREWAGPASFRVSGTADQSPPEIQSIAIEPGEIKSNGTNRAVQLTVRITDEGVGLWQRQAFDSGSCSARFQSPSKQQRLFLQFAPGAQISGDAHDGVYAARAELPPYSEQGVWSLAGLELRDALGNQQSWDVTELARRQLAASFTVTGEEDTVPPALGNFTLSPGTVASGPESSLQLGMLATDDLSGMGLAANGGSGAGANVIFLSPSRNQRAGLQWDVRSAVSNGVYTGVMRLPPYAEPGVWTLDQVNLSDAVGNRQTIYLGEMLRLGFPTAFTVTGQGDTNPPALIEFGLDSTEVLLNGAPQSIVARLRLRDDLSGVTFLNSMGSSYYPSYTGGGIHFISPSGRQSANFPIDRSSRVSGDAMDGVYEAVGLLPVDAEPGWWVLEGISVPDGAGNPGRWDVTDCQRLGFPVRFLVTQVPTLGFARVGDNLRLSWSATATGFALQQTSELSPTGTIWTPAVGAPQPEGAMQVLSVPVEASARFFRLQRAP